MAVTAGTDYALARKTTWVFSSGVGPATAVMTRSALYLFPLRALAGGGVTMTKTTYTIGGGSPREAIERLLAAPDTSPASLDDQLRRWSEEVAGPIVEPMAGFQRIRVFSGWFRRGVVLSKKAAGYDLRPASVRPSKDELPAFVAMLRGRPGVELR